MFQAPAALNEMDSNRLIILRRSPGTGHNFRCDPKQPDRKIANLYSKGKYMHSIISLLILVATGALFFGQTSAAQDSHTGQDIGQVIKDYSNKAVKCKQTGDSQCSASCVEAINLVRNGPSTELAKAAEACNAGFAVIEAERETKISEPPLQEGYAWMPDIDATVIRARGAPFQIEGRDHDWGKYCNWRAKLGAGANDESSRKLVQSPGSKVVLRHVQYPTSHAANSACVIGDVVAR